MSRTLHGLAAVLVVLLAGMLAVLSAMPAQAAPGDPYDANVPVAWQAAGSPTTLYQTQISTGGTVAFVPEGTAAGTYNALVFNPRDGYLYATQNRAGLNVVIRIGQGGAVVDPAVASLPDADPTTSGHQVFFAGGIDPATGVMYVVGTTAGATTMSSIDLASGQVSTRSLSTRVMGLADLTFARGALWTVLPTGDLVRIDPATGLVSTVRADVLPNATAGSSAALYGAGFTLGNGNIVFIDNVSGAVHQIDLSSGTYGDLFMGSATATSNNDAASSLGGPTDLVLAVCGQAQSPCHAPAGTGSPRTTYPLGQDAPTGYTPGQRATYALTVHNDGPGLSTGSVVTDTLPPGTTYVTSSRSTCAASGSTLRCPVGRLAAGGSLTFTVTVDTTAGSGGTLTSAATILANETDPDLADNHDTHALLPQRAAITVHAKADRSSLVLGQILTYTFEVTNAGTVPLSPVTISDPTFGVTGAPCIATVPPGGTVTCSTTVRHRVTQADLDRGVVSAAVTAIGVPPSSSGLAPVTATDTVALRAVQRPALSLVKTAWISRDGNRDGRAGVGDRISYAFLVTNTGNVTLHAVTVDDRLVPPARPAVAVSCPASTLPPSASMRCTSSTPYGVTQADVDAGSVRNSATAYGTPPRGSPVASPRSGVATQTPGGGLEVTMTASLRDRDADGLADVGETIAYRFVVRNTGARNLTRVTVDDDRLTLIGVTVRCPGNRLAPGAWMVCLSSRYSVTQPDVDAGRVLSVPTSAGQPRADRASADRASAVPATGQVDTARSGRWSASREPGGGALAYTGSDVAPTVGAALLALVTGALLTVASRRRHCSRVSRVPRHEAPVAWEVHMGGRPRSAPTGDVDTDATDSVLLLRARSGDLDAVAALWRRHLPGVEVIARQLVAEDRDAEELAADTLTNMLALLLRGSGPASSVQRYLRAATYHNAAARQRRSSREVPVADSARFEVERADLYPDVRQAELDVLRRAFDGLPLRWRTVLLRTAVDHETAATVGAELGLTANAVAALSRRARRALVYAYMSAHFPRALEPSCQRFVRDLAAVVGRRPSGEARPMVHLDLCSDCARRTEDCRQVMRPGTRFPRPVS